MLYYVHSVHVCFLSWWVGGIWFFVALGCMMCEKEKGKPNFYLMQLTLFVNGMSWWCISYPLFMSAYPFGGCDLVCAFSLVKLIHMWLKYIWNTSLKKKNECIEILLDLSLQDYLLSDSSNSVFYSTMRSWDKSSNAMFWMHLILKWKIGTVQLVFSQPSDDRTHAPESAILLMLDDDQFGSRNAIEITLKP